MYFLPGPVYLKLPRNISEKFSISQLVVLVINFTHIFKGCSNFFQPTVIAVTAGQVLRLRFAKKNTTTTMLDANG